MDHREAVIIFTDWRRREAGYSPAHCAQFKNEFSCTSIPPYVFLRAQQ